MECELRLLLVCAVNADDVCCCASAVRREPAHAPLCSHAPALLQVGLFALGAWQACGLVLYSGLQQISSVQWRGAHLRLPWLGLLPVNGVLAGLAAGGICVTWAIWHNAVWSWPLQVGAAAWLPGPCRLVCLAMRGFHACMQAL